jgi:hypothetical protein
MTKLNQIVSNDRREPTLTEIRERLNAAIGTLELFELLQPPGTMNAKDLDQLCFCMRCTATTVAHVLEEIRVILPRCAE